MTADRADLGVAEAPEGGDGGGAQWQRPRCIMELTWTLQIIIQGVYTTTLTAV